MEKHPQRIYSIASDLFTMSAKGRTKYVLLEGCGSARLASEAIEKQVEKISKANEYLKCQELTGCVKGCIEGVENKELDSKSCREFSECIGNCQAEAAKKPLELFKAKAKAPVKARTPPKVAAKPARTINKDAPAGEYARIKSAYNKVLGVHTRPSVRDSSKPDIPQIREGSAEDLLRLHHRAMGRPRGSYY